MIKADKETDVRRVLFPYGLPDLKSKKIKSLQIQYLQAFLFNSLHFRFMAFLLP